MSDERSMPKPRVYVETTIPSFYHTTRPGAAALARRFGHLRRVNALLGIYVPVLATPLELLGEIDDSQN
jgi:hypothetical protein